MMSMSAVMKYDRVRLARSADWLAVAVAVSLPWSTSATGILVVLWLAMLVPTLDLAVLRRELTAPAGGLPVLLVALALLGMLWSNVPWSTAFRGLSPFAKLLIIPLLMVEFRRSDRGLWVLAGFLVSCTALLALSTIIAMWPGLAWDDTKGHGVPVKDYIAQSGEFVICAFALAYVVLDQCRAGRHFMAIALLLLSALFLLDVFYIAASRTALVTIPVLAVLFAVRHFSWKGVAAMGAAGLVLGVTVWASSPYLRERVMNLAYEIEAYQRDSKVTSAGERLYFWKKSLEIIAGAPAIGHGTGTIKSTFERAVAGQSGIWDKATANPHNQTFAIGIQLGLLGVAALFAMWLSHLLLFRGPGLVAWVGLIVVAQNVVSSLFNSHLFDFTQGWAYVFGVGVAGGMVLRGGAGQQRAQATDQAASGEISPDPAQSGV